MSASRDTKAALAASMKAEQKSVRRNKKTGAGDRVSRLGKPVKIKVAGKKKQKLELQLGMQDSALLQALRDESAALGFSVKRKTLLLLALRHLARADQEALKALLDSL